AFMDIRKNVSNMAFMIYPAVIGGYIFVLRSKLSSAENEEEKSAAMREFLRLASITTGLVLFTIVYALMLA
ncbi:unnamed protein product, partial [marine sediment metagenome]